MAYRRRRSSGTKGKHCTRYKRVRVRGQGVAKRCVKFSGGRKSSHKGRKSRHRKPVGMARRGSKCTRTKRVYSRKLHRSVKRCAHFRR